VITNGNSGMEAAFKELIRMACKDENWGREIYYLRKYGNDFFGRCEEEFRDIYEKLKRDPSSHPDVLEAFWIMNQHRKGFKGWQPGRYQSSTLRGDVFDDWWRTVTNHQFIHAGGAFRFCEMWVGGAAQSMLVSQLKDAGRYCSLSETLTFFENFNQPLLPPNIDEECIRTGIAPWYQSIDPPA
jgi:hypothetical protein